MTTYSVVLTEQATRELEAIADWWAIHRSIIQAGRWYEGFSAKIESISKSPEGLPVADESFDFPYELRELHYGLGTGLTHRAVFTIVGEIVVVLMIRHVAQKAIRLGDVEAVPESYGRVEGEGFHEHQDDPIEPPANGSRDDLE